MSLLLVVWTALYTLFSFGLTDPNLVLFQAEWYQSFQAFMWKLLYDDPQLSALIFAALVSFGFCIYFFVYFRMRRGIAGTLAEKVEECALHRTTHFSLTKIFTGEYKKALLVYVLILFPLLFSYNALSHDVFNYIFNAKMVMEYDANPHQQVALDFSEDPWTRFMHNTHTPAPYGYGWTGVSIAPYVLGFGKFFVTWMNFRLLSVFSILGLYVALQYFSVEMRRKYLSVPELFLLFANPLFMIEVVSNMHNDLWMMAPAVAAFAVLFKVMRQKYVPPSALAVSAAFLCFSIMIKFATVVLIIPWLLLVALHAVKLFSLEKIAERIQYPFVVTLLNGGSNLVLEKVFGFVPYISSALLFIPLLTSRSQQFHPWYLLWVFVWLPFIKNPIWRMVLVGFSITSLFRYVPWLATGNFDGDVLTHQKVITWFGVALILVGYYAWTYRKKPLWWR
ncbi:MAG: hypothetical protein H6773_01655 [Pseudomonadales bacterium]|nr:hypothetical protein [Candidatus Woesebacteria bacterium]MCB9800862.1 hypothetical protein [Pseudomonadales bacterium]